MSIIPETCSVRL